MTLVAWNCLRSMCYECDKKISVAFTKWYGLSHAQYQPNKCGNVEAFNAQRFQGNLTAASTKSAQHFFCKNTRGKGFVCNCLAWHCWPRFGQCSYSKQSRALSAFLHLLFIFWFYFHWIVGKSVSRAWLNATSGAGLSITFPFSGQLPLPCHLGPFFFLLRFLLLFFSPFSLFVFFCLFIFCGLGSALYAYCTRCFAADAAKIQPIVLEFIYFHFCLNLCKL